MEPDGSLPFLQDFTNVLCTASNQNHIHEGVKSGFNEICGMFRTA